MAVLPNCPFASEITFPCPESSFARICSLIMNAGQLQFARLNLQTLAGEPHPMPRKLMCEPHCTPRELLALGTFPSTAGAPGASGLAHVVLPVISSTNIGALPVSAVRPGCKRDS